VCTNSGLDKRRAVGKPRFAVNSTARMRTVGTLCLLGTPSAAWCSLSHFCRCGHLAHGPYPVHYWVSDCWALACFASVAGLALRIHTRGRVFLLVVSVVQLLSWLFGSGLCQLALPLLGGVDVYALGYLLTPRRLEMNGEPNTAPNGGAAPLPGNSTANGGRPSMT
jgi:hypothetical protein